MLVDWILIVPTLALLAALAYAFGGFAVLAAERGEPVALGRGLLALYVREATASLGLWLLKPLGLWSAGPRRIEPRPELPESTPVMLIPDYGMNRASLFFLRTFLTYRGWRWAWAINYRLGDRPLSDHAERLSQHVEELLRASGAKQVDLVGHGLGGLIAAWYVRHLDGGRRVRRLVTLGTPWGGTRTAVFRRRAEAREMLLGSPSLDLLAPPVVPTVAIWSPDDPQVVPSGSGHPDGAQDVCLTSAGHNEFLLSARAFRAVQDALTQPELGRTA